jgi:hypothetical protein
MWSDLDELSPSNGRGLYARVKDLVEQGRLSQATQMLKVMEFLM